MIGVRTWMLVASSLVSAACVDPPDITPEKIAITDDYFYIYNI